MESKRTYNYKDITGQQFNRWTALHEISSNTTKWLFVCVCGTRKEVYKQSVISGGSKSCGCLASELTSQRSLKHGHSRRGKLRTETYITWSNMISRCTKINNKAFNRYGGRGITVCQEWHLFENFLSDMGEKPTGAEIDRINNDLGYFKENCRWVTHKENCRNTRNKRFITYKGKTKALWKWEEETGIDREIIRCRLDRGWTPEQAIEAPIGAYLSLYKKGKQSKPELKRILLSSYATTNPTKEGTTE